MVRRPHTARYVEVSDYLRNLLLRHDVREGDLLPTEMDLCKQFRCSRGTVRQAMDLLVREGKVKRQRGAGTFVAEALHLGPKKLIAAIVPNIINSEFVRFTQLLGMAANEVGYTLLLGVTNDMAEIESNFIEEVRHLRAVGLVKFPTNIEIESDLRQRLRGHGIPYVILNDFWTDSRKDHHIAYDECMAVDLAVDHLVSLGHRRIALMESYGGPRVRAIEAFRKAVARHRLPQDEKQILLYDIRDPAPLEAILREGQFCPTGLVTIYDIVAARLLAQLKRMGKSVPGDISIVNVNGRPTIALDQDLTTAVPPERKMIDQTLKLLTDGLHDGHVKHFLYEPEFHVGQTSGPAPA